MPDKISKIYGNNSKGLRQRDAEATREAILQVALEEFADKGLYGARVEEIAARTSTSKHMIYYYFASKDGLYSAVLEQAYRAFRTAERSTDYADFDPAEALEKLIGATFDSHIRNPHTIRILMSENLDRGRHVEKIQHGEQRRLVLGTIQQILDRGVSAGRFHKDVDPQLIHLMISAYSFYFVSNRYTFGTVFNFDMADPAIIESSRKELIKTILARTLVS